MTVTANDVTIPIDPNKERMSHHMRAGGQFGAADTVAAPNFQQDRSSGDSNRYRNKQQSKNYKKIFADYISEEEAQEGVKNKTMITGILRINPKNYQECFLDNPLGTAYSDVLCLGFDRNRAMHGDLVTAKLKPKEEWLINQNEYENWWAKNKSGETRNCSNNKDGQNNKRTLKQEMTENGIGFHELPPECLIQTASIVLINEPRHLRVAAGKLQLMPNNQYYVLFVSTDSRIPRIMIPAGDVDPEFFKRPSDFEKFLYAAKITEWRAESVYANGQLVKLLGARGQIEPETQRILFENDISDIEFSEECLESLPIQSAEQFSIPEEEYEYRRDFRDEIVFTIDPKTARDLDDALSIRNIDDCDGNGTPGFEIGVHIADVTFFLQENTELDLWAERRGNSTYLSQMVIPMLPRILCEQLCSLNPGVDRLAFSVVFKMNYEAELTDVWFGRTVIRSRVKLAYEHAQDFIENPEKDFSTDELPPISDGNTPYEIKEKVLMLNRIAKMLRSRRDANGALRIEQPKLKFTLDPETKEPIGVSVYQIRDSNKLVEEYMLLANMEVAKKIEQSFPLHAFLRCHPPPKIKIMKESITQCEKIGFPLDGPSSIMLSTSFKRYDGNSLLHTFIRQVISTITIKPMVVAKYFCVSSAKTEAEYNHYALNVSRYTHFTSPIRRYPDVVVHRQLAAALGYGEESKRSPELLQTIADRCNEKKAASKLASEQSAELYFALLIHSMGRVSSKAIVLQALDKAFDVLVTDYGVVKRVYCDKLTAKIVSFSEKEQELILEWPEDSEAEEDNRNSFRTVIKMCTVIDVELVPLREIEYGALMYRPNKEQQRIMQKSLRKMLDEGSTIFDSN